MEGEIITVDTLRLAHDIARKRTIDKQMVRVPPRLYQAHPEAYTPLFVSVGPFHHIGQTSKLVQGSKTRFKDVNILATETYKQAFMLGQLNRAAGQWDAPSEEILERCQKFVQENIEKIWSCYCEEIETSPDILANIMLVDGCFLSWFLSHCSRTDIMFFAFSRDLILLENQIPFFILEGLNHILDKNPSSIALQILRRYGLSPVFLEESCQIDSVPECIHMLDLVSKYHLPRQATNNPSILPRRVPRSVPSDQSGVYYFGPSSRAIHLKNATKLRASGVTFQCARGKKLLDLEFSGGVLRIPPLLVSDLTETLLTNLLAHEHLSPTSDGYFTSYVFLMSHLIESKDDLQILEKKGVIHNELGSRQDASKLFLHVRKQFVLKHFWYTDLCKEIEAYAGSKPRRHIQVLKKIYFGSPWTTVSVLAATILLLINILQTVFTVLSYYQAVHPN